ncbi:hypothetical protein [Streptomyces sp. NBC_00140]|uniref:hypothetical protein n=1 Tax=Streptomyces sp. NBC_00140 TaxID=2975664 RepID=UPI0022552C45|nr:hypothetical protein [Streptomyces sp. NBC_00140]MCX5330009.1 hypothetical protein [Streptomyces sp. NBC_00140]
MPLPVIAIIVASASAMFSASSMLISLAAYRRGGPRVKMRVARGTFMLPAAYLTGDETRWRTSYLIRLVNRSSTSMEVEKVQTILQPSWLMLPFRRVLRSAINTELLNRPGTESGMAVEFLYGQDRMKIDPFGGTRWVVQDRTTGLSDLTQGVRGFVFSLLTSMGIRVTLTSGREIYSRPMSIRKIARENDRIFRIVSEFSRKQATNAGQLSFDDLAKEEGS